MTVDIQPAIGNARPVDELQFHFTCLGNFSGLTDERSAYPLMAVNRNSWDGLFEQLKPAITVTISLEGVRDFENRIVFARLADFSLKGITSQIAFLNDLTAFSNSLRQASEDNPLDVDDMVAKHPQLNVLKTMASQFTEGEALDLLNMVDLGAAEETGPQLKYVKKVFSASKFTGHKREAAASEVITIVDDAANQVMKSAEYVSLESHWRGLKNLHAATEKNVSLSLIDCPKDELCDATFLTFIKPEEGDPASIDLLLTTFAFQKTDSDLHILHHLGRMSESLAVPFLMNADPQIFGARNTRLLQHIRDYSGRVSGPEYAKWRKQRDELGSRWLFVCVNEQVVKDGEDQSEQVLAAGSFVFASVLAKVLARGIWPGELMGPHGRLDDAGGSAIILSEEQASELGYEGFCSFTGTESGERLTVLGMNCLATVKIGIGQSPGARDFVEFTLSYSFFVGCLSRYIRSVAGEADAIAKIKEFVGAKAEEDVVLEQEDGQSYFRVKPSFTIFGLCPDVVVGIE